MGGVNLCELGGQQAALGQGELVARDDVVEGQDHGEQAGGQEQLHDVAGCRGDVDLAEVEGEVLGGCAGQRDGLVGPDADDHEPGGDAVEEADEQHRDVGGTGDGSVRVAGFVAEDGGGLESDEAEDGEHQPEAGLSGGELACGEGFAAHAVGSAADADGHGDHHDDQ